jgi:hypothetical protein
MYYFYEIFIGNLTPFVVLETLLIGMTVATSIYFFTKNLLGSTFLSVPFSAIYLFIVYEHSFHLVFIVLELVIQYAFLKILTKFTN